MSTVNRQRNCWINKMVNALKSLVLNSLSKVGYDLVRSRVETETKIDFLSLAVNYALSAKLISDRSTLVQIGANDGITWPTGTGNWSWAICESRPCARFGMGSLTRNFVAATYSTISKERCATRVHSSACTPTSRFDTLSLQVTCGPVTSLNPI